MSTPYNYRDKVIGSGARIQLGLEDTIEITSSAELFVSGGSMITPSNIVLTAVLRGTFKNILPSSIIWKKDGTYVATGSTLSQSYTDAGFSISSQSSSVTYTVEVTLGYGPLAQTVVATKVLSLLVPTILALISPALVLVSTATDGTGGIWGQVITTTINVGDSIATGWLYIWSPSLGISGSSSGNTYTISGMSENTGTITCTASKSGFSSRVVLSVISKSRAGTSGTNGINGTNGTNGLNGPEGRKVLTGYVYWSHTSPNMLAYAPGLTLSTYYFSSDSFSGLNGWSKTITFSAGGTNLTKSFTVTESSPGSDYGILYFGSAYNHTSFDGLVTFTSLGGNGSTTFIDGDRITSGIITGRKIRTAAYGMRVEMEDPTSGRPHTFTGYYSNSMPAFVLTANTGYSIYNGAVLSIDAGQSIAVSAVGDIYLRNPGGSKGIDLRVDGNNTGIGTYGHTIGVWGIGSAQGVIGTGNDTGVQGGSLYGNGVKGTSQYNYAASFVGGPAGVVLEATSQQHGAFWALSNNQGWALIASLGRGCYVPQGYLPFTGLHESLILKNTECTVGDIVYDDNIIYKKDVSNTLSEVKVSASPQKLGVIGVVNSAPKLLTLDNLPNLIQQEEYPLAVGGLTSDPLLDAYYRSKYTSTFYTNILDTYDLVHINALGEGQINVCGEGGNLIVGDLIVTSSILGKGMKQQDDIIRSYTVAKCRENVIFSLPTDIKMVACIYLCG